MTEATTQYRYFVAKVNNFTSLRRAVETKQWACADRINPPQPREILTEALTQGKVVIIFSVSNCHGWHGIAELLNFSVKEENFSATETESNSEFKSYEEKNQTENSSNNEANCTHLVKSKKCDGRQAGYHYFDIRWKLNFLEFGDQCLHSRETEQLACIEKPLGNRIPLNKCRNWQEIDAEDGKLLCDKMQEFYDSLLKRRDERKEVRVESEPFYKHTDVSTVQDTWQNIVNQVERELGKVILACPFGSQRYNLQVEGSDTDMFIVYQAKTSDILGFHPPKQTIKNSENEICDYTIHEIYRYCELLLNGDARCVETLFLHESTIVQSSPEFEALKQGRSLYLNRNCLDKYLRDAQGSRGTKYLQKWCKDNPDQQHLNNKLCKMVYVIVRLLQNARNIVNGEDLVVYREHGTADREVLMSIRAGEITVSDACKIIQELEATIVTGADHVVENTKDVEQFLENWLLTLRRENFV